MNRLLTALASIIALQAVASATVPETDLKDLYLEVVETAVDVFEPIWKDDSERVPNAGYFDFSEYGNWRDDGYAGIITVPGNGMVILSYALLLTRTDKDAFGKADVPRSVLVDRSTKALRWIALTSAHAEKPYPFAPYAEGRYLEGDHWARPLGLRVDMQGWLTVAVALLGDRVGPELRQQLGRALVGESRVPYKAFTWTPREGGLHDCVKHYLSSIQAAAFLFPDWDESPQAGQDVLQSGIDIVATRHDLAQDAVVEGKSVADWVKVWNLYQDYSSDHHGHSQIWYGCDLIFEARTYLELLGHLTEPGVPETYSYDGNGFDGVLEWVKRITLPEGEPCPVHGAEYDSYYGAGLLAFCYGALINQDPVAAALEEQSARLLRTQSRAVGQYDYHRNSWAKAAAAYLMHEFAGPRAEPLPLDKALVALQGTYHHRSQMNLIHRDPVKWVSWSWGILPSRHPDGHCGIIAPYHRDEPPLIYPHANTMAGRIRGDWMDTPGGQRPQLRYSHTLCDNGFHTAGVCETPRLTQYRAFFSFPEGPCVLFTRFKTRGPGSFTWTGLPVYFYVRDGVTRERTIYHAGGSRALGAPAQSNSNWWCVENRLGLIVSASDNTVTTHREPGLNWARIPDYRDHCDVVTVAAVEDRECEAGDCPVDLTAAFFTDTPHDKLAAVAARWNETPLDLPEGWQGVILADADTPEKRYLALANFESSTSQTKFELGFPEGAPVTAHTTRISGESGRFHVQCPPGESSAGVIELYATTGSGQPVDAVKLSRNRYRFSAGAGEARLRLECVYGGVGCLVQKADTGKTVERKTFADNGTLELVVGAPVILELSGVSFNDWIAPAVEITDIAIRADGRMSVTVSAGDQSGVELVTLYVDGEPLSARDSEPYQWTHWPGAGAHTLHAVAVDASANSNKRASLKRTVVVEPGQPPY